MLVDPFRRTLILGLIAMRFGAPASGVAAGAAIVIGMLAGRQARNW